jgi:hypothetical protein
MEDFAAAHGAVRLLEPRFMEIQQAVGTTCKRSDETIRSLREFVEELKSGGFIAKALRRAGRIDDCCSARPLSTAPRVPITATVSLLAWRHRAR